MSRTFRWLLFGSGFILTLGLVIGWPWWRALTQPVTQSADGQAVSVYLLPGANLDSLVEQLVANNALRHERDFRRIAALMKLGPSIKPGHYRVEAGLTARECLIPIRLGHQDPVRLTFNKFRTPEDLSGHVAQRFSFDSTALLALLVEPDSLAHFGLTPEDRLWAFLPNTYEVWWFSSPQSFIARMVRERDAFWDRNGRRARAAEMGLTPLQISTLASIVEEEQAALPDEWPRIAGLYLNRVKRGMLLQADPTIKFAKGDFAQQRVYFADIEATADSPWNTYHQAGIPPGPICTASPRAIDAVLHAEDHSYIFMCAKADFSGYHAFARSNREHERNRALFIAAQNRRGIR